MPSPMQKLTGSLRQHSLVRYVEHFAEMFPTGHLKDVVVDEIRSDRTIVINGRQVVNFGSDSFLGLDHHPRVKQAIECGLQKWGTHNGASRAFSSVRANTLAEEKLADWLGTEAALIFPSVTLANMGALPGLMGKPDVLVVDEQAHNSIHEGARIAKANGIRVLRFSHCDPDALEHALVNAGTYRSAVVAIDGVFSMSGSLPPLRDLNDVAMRHDAVLYVDDAHGTGILGQSGRGTVLDALGSYENTLVVGSLSKAFSCAGAFIGCTHEIKRLLKIRSNTYIFGGPVPPPYLEAVCEVCDILRTPEYDVLRTRLDGNVERFVHGLRRLGLTPEGGATPILSVLVGDEEATFRAGEFLFRNGFYVQSVAFPAVPYHAAVLRVQVNASHTTEQVDRLLNAFAAMMREIPLPLAA